MIFYFIKAVIKATTGYLFMHWRGGSIYIMYGSGWKAGLQKNKMQLQFYPAKELCISSSCYTLKISERKIENFINNKEKNQQNIYKKNKGYFWILNYYYEL
ncbi:MAG TPA: hypothetical protein VK484_09875 [Ferruginibacter sp.]|nr:hypothetical protein [Ferruginibacter sp.]